MTSSKKRGRRWLCLKERGVGACMVGQRCADILFDQGY